MANIKIVVEGPLMDGHKVTFKAPCNCSSVDKLDVYYIQNGTQSNKLFTMKDSHGNDLTGLGNLFKKDAYVDVVLDTVNGFAYLQNAATNSYLESKLLIEDPENPGCFYRMVDGVREWDNPPMKNGVVYKTTKRCMDKPVYVQCGDLGQLPNSSTITKALGSSGQEFDRVIHFNVEAYSDSLQRYIFPIIKTTGISAHAFFDNARRTITVRSIDDNSMYQGRYYIEYTIL